jgi:hypothetical protein
MSRFGLFTGTVSSTIGGIATLHIISDAQTLIRLLLPVPLSNAQIKLAERIIVYELPVDSDGLDMRYKLKAKLRLQGECRHLLVFAQHVLLVTDNKIQCFRFDGMLEREWVLDGQVTMVRPLGGSTGKESCLIGLQDGNVMQLFVHSQFPVSLLKLKSAPMSADLSVKRKFVAIIDTQHNCYVYEVATAQLVYQVRLIASVPESFVLTLLLFPLAQELNANAVAWNQHFDEMLCFSNGTTLTIKCDCMTTFHQQVQVSLRLCPER